MSLGSKCRHFLMLLYNILFSYGIFLVYIRLSFFVNVRWFYVYKKIIEMIIIYFTYIPTQNTTYFVHLFWSKTMGGHKPWDHQYLWVGKSIWRTDIPNNCIYPFDLAVYIFRELITMMNKNEWLMTEDTEMKMYIKYIKMVVKKEWQYLRNRYLTHDPCYCNLGRVKITFYVGLWKVMTLWSLWLSDATVIVWHVWKHNVPSNAYISCLLIDNRLIVIGKFS